MNKVRDWMEAVAAGDLTVDEVAQKLREGALAEEHVAGTMEESLATDREFDEGSFDEISRALHLKLIDIDQYGILAEAAAGRDNANAEAAKAPAKTKPVPAPKPKETDIPDDSTA